MSFIPIPPAYDPANQYDSIYITNFVRDISNFDYSSLRQRYPGQSFTYHIENIYNIEPHTNNNDLLMEERNFFFFDGQQFRIYESEYNYSYPMYFENGKIMFKIRSPTGNLFNPILNYYESSNEETRAKYQHLFETFKDVPLIDYIEIHVLKAHYLAPTVVEAIKQGAEVLGSGICIGNKKCEIELKNTVFCAEEGLWVYYRIFYNNIMKECVDSWYDQNDYLSYPISWTNFSVDSTIQGKATVIVPGELTDEEQTNYNDRKHEGYPEYKDEEAF